MSTGSINIKKSTTKVQIQGPKVVNVSQPSSLKNSVKVKQNLVVTTTIDGDLDGGEF